MKKSTIMIKAGRTLSRAGLRLKKHSPEILVISGVIGVVASGVMACRATTKASAIIEERSNQIDEIHECEKTHENDTEYTAEDAKKDLVIVNVQTVVKFAKLYAPSVALGVLSITSILVSHGILRKRNAAIMAAYAAVDRSFKAYRQKVKEQLGEDVEHELRRTLKKEEISIADSDDSNNMSSTPQKVQYSDFARFFDETNPYWSKQPEYNLMFLNQTERFMNQKLQAQGHLTLNEVYDALGIPKTKAGMVVGWYYDPYDEELSGDNYVDFGIFDPHNAKARDFVNGDEPAILLDFNVDGVIYDLI